jgi:aryl-alcohol dehydrogenase-like predicted oxidoreductase
VATGGAVDDTESVKTLHHAYEHGINFVDTAELYGSGHSEEVIGEPLRQPTQDRPSIKTGGPVLADGRDSSTRGKFLDPMHVPALPGGHSSPRGSLLGA